MCIIIIYFPNYIMYIGTTINNVTLRFNFVFLQSRCYTRIIRFHMKCFIVQSSDERKND